MIALKKLFNRVLNEMMRKFETKRFNNINIDNFKYDDYEDIILQFAYTHYMQSIDNDGPYDIDTLKRYIISYSTDEAGKMGSIK